MPGGAMALETTADVLYCRHPEAPRQRRQLVVSVLGADLRRLVHDICVRSLRRSTDPEQ